MSEGMKITENRWAFVCSWYGVDEIHRQLTRTRDPLTNERSGIPRDTTSLDFAEWLAEQYRLAMAKGADIAIAEMKDDRDPWRRMAERLEAEKVELIDKLRKLYDFSEPEPEGRTYHKESIEARREAAELLRKHGG